MRRCRRSVPCASRPWRTPRKGKAWLRALTGESSFFSLFLMPFLQRSALWFFALTDESVSKLAATIPTFPEVPYIPCLLKHEVHRYGGYDVDQLSAEQRSPIASTRHIGFPLCPLC